MTQSFASAFLALDKDTQPFFTRRWHLKPIEARFHLTGNGLENRVFVGRLVPINGVWHPVIREEVAGDEGVVSECAASPCFILGDAAPYPANRLISPEHVRMYWEARLQGAGTSIKPAPGEPMRTLPVSSLWHCHFDGTSKLGTELHFSWQGKGSGHLRGLSYLRDLSNGPSAHLQLPDMPTDVAWVGAKTANDWLRSVVDLGAGIGGQMKAILGDPTERVAQAFEFFKADDDARLCVLLDCDGDTLAELCEMFERALQFEMSQNPLLQGAQQVQWGFWSDEPLLVDGVRMDVPDTLEKERRNIYALLGLAPRYVGCSWNSPATMDEFVLEVSWDWGRHLGVIVDAPSAHDIAMSL